MDYEQEILELKNRITILEDLLKINNNTQSKIKEYQTIKRDKTKYAFNGKIMPKNRLVLSVVKEYVKRKNPTFIELEDAFDKSLQGSLGVVQKFDSANTISDASKRFFMQDDEIIPLVDNSIAVVCTQWGAFNINRFIHQAQSLGFIIEKI